MNSAIETSTELQDVDWRPAGAAPLVSVVIPAYNSQQFICEAIDSVLRQTHPQLEIIVVDDGSTDDTVAAVARFGDKIRLIEQINQGSAVARNSGISAARGALIAFLDADDVWHPKKLELQIDAMRTSRCKMVYSKFLFWRTQPGGTRHAAAELFTNPTDDAKSTADVPSGWLYAQLMRDCIVWTSTVVVEKKMLRAVGGFNPDLRKGQDWDLWLRLSQAGTWTGVAEYLALYRIHGSSITHKRSKINYEYKILTDAINRWGLSGPDGSSVEEAFIQRRMGRSCVGFGRLHLSGGDPQISRESFRLAMQHLGYTPKCVTLWVFAVLKCALTARAVQHP